MNKSCLFIIILLICKTSLCVSAKSAWLATNDEDATLLRADSIIADHELGLIKAQGNVEIYRDERQLKADLVTYSEKSNIVTASGNVILIEPNGEEAFSNYVELSGDLKEGTIQEIRVIMADDAKFAAATAK